MRQDVVDAPAVDVSVHLAGMALPNPVLAASGCANVGRELADFLDVSMLGALVTPSVAGAARSGLPTPRLVETPSGLLNAVGLPGPGIDGFLAEDLPWLDKVGGRAVVSIAGASASQFADLAGRVRGAPAVVALEVNLACPDPRNDGRPFGVDPTAAADVLSRVRAAADPGTPVFAKLCPDVTDIVAVARACVRSGADGLTVINTVAGMAIDPYTMRPALGGVVGGLSGPAIRPIAVRCVWQVHRALPEVPLIGTGGITCGLDALQFVLAGASAVCVGSALFHDPGTPLRVRDELSDLLAERGFDRLADAVGAAHRTEAGPDRAVDPVVEEDQ